MNEKIIDIRDLMLHLVKKWKWILLGMLVCAILCDVAIVAKNMYQAKKVTNMPVSTTEEKLKAAVEAERSKLNELEAKNAEHSARAYIQLYKQLESFDKVMEESLLFQLDMNDIVTFQHSYLVEVNNPVLDGEIIVAREKNIAAAMVQAVNSKKLWSELGEVIGYQGEVDSLKKLITISNNNNLSNNNNYIEGNVLYISIALPSDSDTAAVQQAIEQVVNECADSIRPNVGDFQLQTIDKSIIDGAKDELLNLQSNQRTTYNSLSIAMRQIETGLTANERPYCNALLAYAFADTNQNDVEQDTPAPSVKVSLVSKKGLLLGAFAGCVLVCGVFGLLYMFDSRIHVPEELSEILGLPIIGHWKENEKNKPWISKVMIMFGQNQTVEKEIGIQLCAAEIIVAVNKMGISNLVITGESGLESAAVLAGILEKEGVSVQLIPSISKEVSSLKVVQQAECIVLIEKMNQTYFKCVKQEADICHRYEIPILGAIYVA